ncbi:MAG: alcohol dehydrogenase catalytic domain-containing protein [Deltaproteobacteria bacterium]|nr:alcohol dehydrogenase catalytic domain-containing protein [Deltaproteobacteria bacterium]
MQAVVFGGKEEVSVQDVPEPKLTNPDGVILQVEQTAICGSDLHFYWGEFGDVSDIRPGHEFMGTVMDVGGEVKTFAKGDRVLASALVGCGKCPGCHGGNVIQCEAGWQCYGVGQDLVGGQAEAVAVPAADFNLLKIPDFLSAEEAVLLTDVLPTGYIGAKNAEILPGHTVAVIGLGPVGLCAVLCAQMFGAARILAVDRVPERLAKAVEYGAIPVDVSDGGTLEKIFDYTDGRGADSVIEAIGADQTINDALMAAKIGGVVSCVGISSNMNMPFPALVVIPRNLTIRMAVTPVQSTWPELLPMIESGRLVTGDIFTHRIPLSEADRAYKIFANREDGCLKVMLDPSQ